MPVRNEPWFQLCDGACCQAGAKPKMSSCFALCANTGMFGQFCREGLNPHANLYMQVVMQSAMPSPRPRVTVVVPAEGIAADAAGFSQLALIHHELMKFTRTDIDLDFSRLDWIDAHLGAALELVVRHAELRGNVIKHIANDRTARVLCRNDLPHRGAVGGQDIFLPMTEFRLDRAVEFSRYAEECLSQSHLPSISEEIQRKIIEGADELFSNAALHSASELGVIASSHSRPADDKFRLIIVDGGRTIPGSVRDARIRYASDDEAINWAMIADNTTKRGSIPGGLGLKVLRRFVESNRGTLAIVSRRGYWCQTGDLVYSEVLAREYPGTAVILDVNASDKTKYDSDAMADPRDIW